MIPGHQAWKEREVQYGQNRICPRCLSFEHVDTVLSLGMLVCECRVCGTRWLKDGFTLEGNHA